MLLILAQCNTFRFTVQPPTTLDCNPFDTVPSPPVWRLRTSCTAERLSGTQSFDVNWFHRKRTGEIENLSRPEMWTYSDTQEQVYFGSQWTNRPYDMDMLGDYWCQVIVTSQQPNLFLGISNIITIDEYSAYNTRRCTEVKIVTETLCADQPPTIEPSVTTTSNTMSSKLPISISLISTSPLTSTFNTGLSSSASLLILSPEGPQISSSDLSSIPHTPMISHSTISSVLSPLPQLTMTRSSSTSLTITEQLDMVASISLNVSPSPNDVMNIINTIGNDSLLLIASIAAIAMLILIIILLTIIAILAYTKPQQRRKPPAGLLMCKIVVCLSVSVCCC